VPGTDDKRLVCLLCTTEPEKLRDTIKARCMTFGIREPNREEVVERLKLISAEEDLSYEEEALDMIFASGRGHIRDMVSALERISRVGDITVGHAREQLGLTATANYYKILGHLGTNLPDALNLARETIQMAGAPSAYYGIAEACLGAYRTSLGQDEGIASVDLSLAKSVMTRHGESLLQAADRILSSSKKIDETVLLCELVVLHRFFSQGIFFPTQEVSKLEQMPLVIPSVPIVSSEKEDEEPEAVAPKAQLSNTELSRDPTYSAQYGSLGSQFVRQGSRIENVESDDDSEDSLAPPRTLDMRRPDSGMIQDVRSLFDE